MGANLCKAGTCIWNGLRQNFFEAFLVFNRIRLVDVFSLCLHVTRCRSSCFLYFVCLWGCLQKILMARRWEEWLESPFKSRGHFGAVLFKALHPKCPDCTWKPKDLRINPSWSVCHCPSGCFTATKVHDFLRDTHNLGKCYISRVGGECTCTWITYGFLDNFHRFGIVKAFTPFRYFICFGQQTFAV